VAEAEAELERALQKHYAQSIKSVHEITEEGLGISFQLDDVVTRAFLKEAGSQIGNIAASTLRMVRRELQQGQEAGESVDQLAKRLRQSPAFSPARARTIARTELGHASNTAAVYTYKASQLVESVLVFDGEEHPFCREWNGKVIPLDQMGSVPKLAHPNCVRAFGPVVKAAEQPKPTEVKPDAPHLRQFIDEEITVDDITKNIKDQKLKLQAPYQTHRFNLIDTYKRTANKLNNPIDSEAATQWRELAIKLAGGKKYDDTVGHLAVKQLKDKWDSTSSGDGVAVAMQMAVNKEFKLKAPTEHFSAHSKRDGTELFGRYEQAFRAAARAQYDETQEFLRSQGITELMGWRGMKWSEGGADKPQDNFDFADRLTPGKIKAKMQPINSYAWDVDIARGFAFGADKSAVVGVRIPAERIYSIPHTGAGVFAEKELVVFGSQEEAATVVTWQRGANVQEKDLIKQIAAASKIKKAKWLASELVLI
jgi:hypothetical protein